MTNTENRLNELLDEKDREIAQLRADLEEAERRAEIEHKWYIQTDRDVADDGGLPVPRLELVWSELTDRPNGYTWFVRYDLVKRHLCGHLVVIPLGGTRTTMEDRSPVHNGKIDLPFRDGAHIAFDALTLNLPAFVRWGERVETVDPAEHTGAARAARTCQEGGEG